MVALGPYLVHLRSQQFLKGPCDPDSALLNANVTYGVATICEITSI